MGRIKVKYANIFTHELHIRNQLMSVISIHDLFIMTFVCMIQLRSLDMYNPRRFTIFYDCTNIVMGIAGDIVFELLVVIWLLLCICIIWDCLFTIQKYFCRFRNVRIIDPLLCFVTNFSYCIIITRGLPALGGLSKSNWTSWYMFTFERCNWNDNTYRYILLTDIIAPIETGIAMCNPVK